MPKVDEYFDKGVFDVGLVPELAELGLFGHPSPDHSS